jgi:FAD/FMN-containing dehydrogenase
MTLQSWGGYPVARSQLTLQPAWRDEPLPLPRDRRTVLPRGLGRSYGDSCLNEGNALLLTRSLNRFIAFDREQGLLRCEAGVSLAEILRLIVPQGWFLPVTPGTKFITVGGAIANDIHGKNHHAAGNFGNHVTRFELLRSDGSRRVCSRTENTDWFRATIGGLGLTGLITWAEFRLQPVANAAIAQETVKYRDLEEFFRLSEESTRDYAYTVAWIDCLARGRDLGRGLFTRGNHAPAQADAPLHLREPAPLSVPMYAPNFTLNSLTVRAFNFAYYGKQQTRVKRAITHYDPFFYPLDAIHHWNRVYGRRGFLQYQCVVPYKQDGGAVMRKLLETISDARAGTFLVVLKTFGDKPGEGMLSFPRPGVTLALDFPNQGSNIFRLLNRLDEITGQAGGLVYPAKDARMSPTSFAAFYPQYREFARYVDPRFSSSFWRRVTGEISEGGPQ